MSGDNTGGSNIATADAGDGGEEEKYKLRAKILEKALLTMRAKYEGSGTEGGEESTVVAAKVAMLKEELEKSDKARGNLQRIVNEAEKDVKRFQERTDLLEKALSKSREKSQGLERTLYEARNIRNEMNAEMENMRRENSRLISELEQYEEELLDARKARIHGRKQIDDDTNRLMRELDMAKKTIREMESDYSAQVTTLTTELESAQENEGAKVDQLKLMIQSARTEAAELKVTLDVRDRTIMQLKLQQQRGGGTVPGTEDLDGRLERTTELLESAIALLSASNDNMRSRQESSEREGSIGSQAADYLIAGDLRDQRRILEMQSDLLNKLLVQIEASDKNNQRVGWPQQQQQQQPSSSISQDSSDQEVMSWSSPSTRRFPAGQGVSIPRVKNAAGVSMRPRVLLKGKRALHGVKRGLGFLIGLEVPPFQERQRIIDTELPSYFGSPGGEGWEDDLNNILNG